MKTYHLLVKKEWASKISLHILLWVKHLNNKKSIWRSRRKRKNTWRSRRKTIKGLWKQSWKRFFRHRSKINGFFLFKRFSNEEATYKLKIVEMKDKVHRNDLIYKTGKKKKDKMHGSQKFKVIRSFWKRTLKQWFNIRWCTWKTNKIKRWYWYFYRIYKKISQVIYICIYIYIYWIGGKTNKLIYCNSEFYVFTIIRQ